MKVALSKLDAEAETELHISFSANDSYFLRTPTLSGIVMESALEVAKEIAKLDDWDHLRNFVVLRVWRANEFTFLGTEAKESEVTFTGKGNEIIKLIDAGLSAEVSSESESSVSFESVGKSGPVVMQVFRVKRNGDIF